VVAYLGCLYLWVVLLLRRPAGWCCQDGVVKNLLAVLARVGCVLAGAELRGVCKAHIGLLSSFLQQISSRYARVVWAVMLATLILYLGLVYRPHCVALPHALDALCYGLGVGWARLR
jgi:hypothetical protein